MLDIKFTKSARQFKVRVSGEIDIACAEQFDNFFLDLMTKDCIGIEIDLAELEFVDSTGVRSLISVLKSALKKQIGIRIINIQPMVYDVLETTGVIKLFGKEIFVKA